MAKEPCRIDARIVDDQHVSRTQQARKVRDPLVNTFPGAPREPKQTGLVAHRLRLLGDQLVRQIVVEVRKVHGAFQASLRVVRPC